MRLVPCSAPRLPPLPTIGDLLKLYKLRALKQLAQNFLLDHKLTNKIVHTARPKWQSDFKDFIVVEVGPGPGGLTRSILNLNPKKVIVIEKDRRFRPTLDLLNECSGGKLEAYWGDVLSFNMSHIIPQQHELDVSAPEDQGVQNAWEDYPPNIRIIGNLPFNVSTPLIVRWLRDISLRQNAWTFGRVPLVLTFQEEVAQRLVAGPSEDQRCRLSVMAQVWADVNHSFTIPGSAFVPKPDVDVGVVKFIPKKVPLISQPFELVEKVVRHIFSMRRKILKHPVGTLFPEIIRTDLTQRMFDMTGINPESRPFQLTNEEFGLFCNAYAELVHRYPILLDYNYRGHKPNEIWEGLHADAPQFQQLQLDNEKLGSKVSAPPPSGTVLRILDEDPSLGLPC